MAEYDQIGESRAGLSRDKSYNGLDYEQVRSAFQFFCRTCNPEVALKFALEAYFTGGDHRRGIFSALFMVVLEDKGLANTMLFTQVFQLMVPLLTRDWDERSLEEKLGPEEWKKIANYPEYEASSLGRIRKKESVKVSRINKIGLYNFVNIDDTPIRVDLLVGTAFAKQKNKLDIYIEHLDEDYGNDIASNLYWTSGARRIPKPPFIEFKFVTPIRYDNLERDPDRLSYIYRFALAVWITALSPTTRVNAWGSIIFNDIMPVDPNNDEEVAEYIEKYGNSDNCKDDLLQALTEKNMADCLYFARTLHCHPQTVTNKTIKWARSRNSEGKIKRVNHACVYIWDCFTKVANRIAHVIPYLESMRSLAMTEDWRDNDRSKLLYTQFIHMWCMDPITAFVDMTRDRRTLKWGDQDITGSFSVDFRTKGKPVRISGKWTSLANLSTDEPVLFPISYNEFFEPMMPNLVTYIDRESGEEVTIEQKELKYTDPLSGSEVIIPDFNPYFQQVIDAENVPVIPKAAKSKYMNLNEDLDSRNMQLIYTPAILVNQDPKWLPLSAFYGFFRFYDDIDLTQKLEEMYDDRSVFFQSRDYPDPFEEKADLSKTEFLSFKPFINKLIGVEEEIKTFTNVDPERRKQLRSRSTFFYRAIPSPIKKKNMPKITITYTKRESPLKAFKNTPSAESRSTPRMPTERVRVIKPVPLPSPYEKKPKKKNSPSTQEEEEEELSPTKEDEGELSEASFIAGLEHDYSTERSDPSVEPVAASPVAKDQSKRKRIVRIRVTSPLEEGGD